MGPRLIGLSGLGGAGKSTVAHELRGMGFEVVVTCEPLKAALRAILAAFGISMITIERMIEGDLKRKPCALLGGISPTAAMQTLGTDWGRNLVSADLWINPAQAKITAALASRKRVVLDNVRFENEAEAVRALGGEVWRVIGRGDMTLGQSGHATELFAGPFDRIVRNVGTLDDLRASIFRGLTPRQ
jgi:hypothetical protein